MVAVSIMSIFDCSHVYCTCSWWSLQLQGDMDSTRRNSRRHPRTRKHM